MRASKMIEAIRGPLERAVGSPEAAILTRFHDLVLELSRLAEGDETPERVRSKATLFLEVLDQAHREHDERLFHTAWLLNACGEAMARSEFLHASVVELVQVGLYFWGLDQIERRWSRQAAVYSGIHAEAVMAQVSRAGLKDLLAEARARAEEGRVFCLTYSYLNRLRKAYWAFCRESQDALDVAATGEDLESVLDAHEVAVVAAEEISSASRLDVMMSVFERELSSQQQWIYLAKNRGALDPEDGAAAPMTLEQFLARMTEPVPEDRLGWSEIALRLGLNEKTVKREYLRSLHALLRQTGEAIFGPQWVPSGLVRRVLEQLQSVVQEKDLRIRHSTGRGMGPLIEKWQVALRFVLNTERVSA